MKISKTIEERFWNKVIKTKGCWIWKGAMQRGGYGVISAGFWKGKIIAAHRFSWYLHSGKYPNGKVVCHKCDNPACVKPAHLYIGTHADNVKDKVSKGRQAILTGKLSRKDVIKIRTLCQTKEITQIEISKKYNITRQFVYRIKKRLSFKHINQKTPILTVTAALLVKVKVKLFIGALL